MSLKGITVSDDLICQPHIDGLAKDHMTRYKAVPKTRVASILPAHEKWLVIGADYPAQMAERLRLLNERADYYIDRLSGPEVAAAEIELRDTVVDYLCSAYKDYFYRNGRSVVNRLTGVSIRLDEADPLVTIGLLAAEDMCILMPSNTPDIMGNIYRLSSGVLIQPSGWSLTSKFNASSGGDDPARQESLEAARLGKTSYEIHAAKVSHYAKYFADKVERFYRNMNAGVHFWRRNWGPYKTGQLSLHHDLPSSEQDLQTPQDWRDKGFIRSEHEGFVKLPGSKAVVFSIRTFLWRVADIEKNPEALAALITAYDNLSPEMAEYRGDRLPSFGAYLNTVRPMASMTAPASPFSGSEPA